jgi:chloramphenicol O-acetyltransferase type A
MEAVLSISLSREVAMIDRPNPLPIDLEEWSRREAFELFRSFGFPYLSLTAEVDVTLLREATRGGRVSFTIGFVHAVARAANAVAALRQRLRGDGVIEHRVVHPSITILAEDDSFRFCTLPFDEDLTAFSASAAERIETARRAGSMFLEPDRDDFLFMTAIPWVSFTAMVHPVPLDPPSSVPRFAWGRFRDASDRVVLPLNVQAHHALVDGIHIGRFFGAVQDVLDRFGRWGGRLA